MAALGALLVQTGCVSVGYEGAIGYRSRQAALQKNVDEFRVLMEEASETEPKSRLDNPKKTVLTHFLELADSPEFLAIVEEWNAKGWVDDDMVCPVYRAHFAAHHARAPEAAARSADVVMSRARSVAGDETRGWELDLCLLEAPMLVETATAALAGYLEMATDPGEPEAFRRGLLRGLTFREGFGPRERWGVTSTLTPDQRRLRAEREALGWRDRLAWVLEALSGEVPPTELAIASARGALEVEAVLAGFGESFVAGYAESARPDHQAWAWGWVRAMKHRSQVDHLAGLGLWDPAREPRADAYWYLCAAPPGPPKPGPLGPRVTIDARTLRAAAHLEAPRAGFTPACPAENVLVGPYPLEQVARTAARAAAAAELEAQARIVVRVRDRTVHSTE